MKLLALLSLLAPLAANAMSITYDVSRSVGIGTVMGTITTDGTIGTLGAANLTAWDLVLNDGTDSSGLNSANAFNSLFFSSDTPLTATQGALFWNWGTTSGAIMTFLYSESPTEWRWELSDVFGGELVSHSTNNAVAHQELQSRSGLTQIATAQATALPEPGTLGLALIGLAGLSFTRKRKQR